MIDGHNRVVEAVTAECRRGGKLSDAQNVKVAVP